MVFTRWYSIVPIVSLTNCRRPVRVISLITSERRLEIFLQTWNLMVAIWWHLVAEDNAARSIPAFVGNSTFIVTSFTLVHEFKNGRLQNLFWKRDVSASCSAAPSEPVTAGAMAVR